mmetsp:Transcript_43123/g.90587  ORF Transcript_43123/g.90587 Transcript_43123/m.90587 type:complete len:242 (+) Transcript_43123:290-1015(+)
MKEECIRARDYFHRLSCRLPQFALFTLQFPLFGLEELSQAAFHRGLFQLGIFSHVHRQMTVHFLFRPRIATRVALQTDSYVQMEILVRWQYPTLWHRRHRILLLLLFLHPRPCRLLLVGIRILVRRRSLASFFPRTRWRGSCQLIMQKVHQIRKELVRVPLLVPCKLFRQHVHLFLQRGGISACLFVRQEYTALGDVGRDQWDIGGRNGIDGDGHFQQCLGQWQLLCGTLCLICCVQVTQE